jgi:hypothetical protein
VAKNSKTTLQPGDKIYTLFEYKEVVIKGSKETFIIRIEKIEDNSRNYETVYQHVRAMG